jgi:hypothetical protein
MPMQSTMLVRWTMATKLIPSETIMWGGSDHEMRWGIIIDVAKDARSDVPVWRTTQTLARYLTLHVAPGQTRWEDTLRMRLDTMVPVVINPEAGLPRLRER